MLPIFKQRRWHPTPVLLPGKSHGQRILVDCSPWGRKELDTTERLHPPSFLVPQHTGDLDHGQIEAMLAKIPIQVLFRNTKRGLLASTVYMGLLYIPNLYNKPMKQVLYSILLMRIHILVGLSTCLRSYCY